MSKYGVLWRADFPEPLVEKLNTKEANLLLSPGTTRLWSMNYSSKKILFALAYSRRILRRIS